MRISRLLMPAVTFAGALALAGCGGGSGGTGTTPTCPTGQTGTPPNCVPATDAQQAATTAVNTAARQAEALGATSDATAVNAARASLTAAVNAVNALPAAQRGQFSTQLNRASGQIRTQELRLARAAGADEVDLIAYVRDLYNSLGGVGWDPTANSNAGGYDLAPATANNGILATKPDALKNKGDAITLGTLKGYEYAGRDRVTQHMTEGVVLNTQGKAKDHLIGSAGAATAIAVIANQAAVDDKGVVTISAGVVGSNVESPDFKSVGTSTVDQGPGVKGKFYGVDGTFTCAASSCTLTSTNTGITFAGPDWRFTPDGGASAKVSVPDTQYQKFGWWLTVDDEGEPRTTGLFQGPKTGTGPLVAATSTLATKATYKGGTVGLYARHHQNVDAEESGDSGSFTADVTLRANFKDTSLTRDDASSVTVEGDIENFMVEGTSKPWKVELLEGPLQATGSVRWLSTNGKQIGSGGGYYIDAYGSTVATKVPDELGGVFRADSDEGRLTGAMAATDPK